jgi:glycosyltransferase involved in cell wall biosynthesis
MCKFTIAIPVYNGIKNITKAVKSAINQDFEFEFEVLVVDNDSNDGTSEILNRYSNKIEIVKNIKTVSMYENHNICLKEAKGDYVLFCHSDDELRKNALSILYKEISAYDFPEKFVIWGRSMFRDYGEIYKRGGGEINKVLTGMDSVKSFIYSGLTPSGTCYSRKSFTDLGGFLNCSHRLSPSDWTTMMMLALDGFEFKMIDRIYFQRTFASTLVTGTAQVEVRRSLVDAISELQKNLSKEKFDRLIDITQGLDVPPMNFYYACVQNEISCNRIRKILIKKILKRPILLRNNFVRRIFLAHKEN